MPGEHALPGRRPRSGHAAWELPLLRDASAGLLLADFAVVFWVVTWVVVGGLVGIEVRNLGRIGDSMVNAGHALDDTAAALGRLDGVPFIGGRIGTLANDISDTARTVGQNASQTRASANRLSYLLAACIMIVPSVPVLAFYVPYRTSRNREIRAMRRLIESGGDTASLEEYLANRALVDLGFARLMAISSDPWRDVREGRFRPLAQAELESLGLKYPGLPRA